MILCEPLLRSRWLDVLRGMLLPIVTEETKEQVQRGSELQWTAGPHHGRSLDQQMQSLDCGLATFHRNEQVYRMRRQNIFVDDNPVLLQNLNRLKWQI
jgi:hypothetical protein